MRVYLPRLLVVYNVQLSSALSRKGAVLFRRRFLIFVLLLLQLQEVVCKSYG